MVNCSTTSGIDVQSLLPVMMMKGILAGEEFNLDPVIDVMINKQIAESLLANVTLPSDFAELGDVICLQVQMGQLKAVQAALRGETAEFNMDKIIDMVVNLQLLSAIESAFGGATAT